MVKFADLPAPPPGRTGWPWTLDGTGSSPAALRAPAPRVSIFTPSYNQGRFLEETIRSVLLQNYPDLEYFVIDGGSTDESVDVIRKYEPWITYWISEKDRGQSHAINKGFAKATGALFTWINSDDFLAPNGIARLVMLAQQQPEASAWVGACSLVDESGRMKSTALPRLADRAGYADWWYGGWFYQPASMFSGVLFRQVGGLNERLHFVMDVDLWLRLTTVAPIVGTNDITAFARQYPGIKTLSDPEMGVAERIAVCMWNDLPLVARRVLVRAMQVKSDAETAAYREVLWPYSSLLRHLVLRTFGVVKRLVVKPLCRRPAALPPEGPREGRDEGRSGRAGNLRIGE